MVDASPFFVVGGTLRGDAPCYVTRGADERLIDNLEQGKFCYVLTPRQMGKSSLVVHTVLRLREAGCTALVLDLTSIGLNLSADQWYFGLLLRIGQQLDLESALEDFWDAQLSLGPLQRWTQALRTVVLPACPGPVVVFVDEIDVVLRLPFSTDEFFAAIRELYNARNHEPDLERLTFCLLGVASPTDLIRDTRTTPFNIGVRIELNDFTLAEAAPLARGLGGEEAHARALLSRVLRWTGGHPYLTQCLCQALAEAPGGRSVRRVDLLCQELFFSPGAREKDNNLIFVRERVLSGEQDRAEVLTVYQQIRRGKTVRDDETDPILRLLHLSGLVRLERGRLKVRNLIYYRAFDVEWVTRSMPHAELRRQREAFRRGLFRAAAGAAVVVGLLLALALVAYRNAKVAEQQRDHAREADEAKGRVVDIQKHLLYAAHLTLASQAWEEFNDGRMLELLEMHRPRPGEDDLRDFEWYWLWGLGHGERASLGDGRALMSADVSPDGRWLATWSLDSAVTLLELATGRKHSTFQDKPTANQLRSVRFSPDGTRVAAVSVTPPGVALWTLKTGSRQVLETAGNALLALDFSPDGRRLYAGDASGTIRSWEVVTGQPLDSPRDRGGPVLSLQISRDGRLLALGEDDGTVRLWDLVGRRPQATFRLPGRALAVALSPDGTRVAAASSNGIAVVWEIASGQSLLLREHEADVETLAFSPDGAWLATGGMDRIPRLWNTRTGQLEHSFRGHRAAIRTVLFTPDGKSVISAAGDGEVRVWDALDRSEPSPAVLEGHRGAVHSLAFSSDGRWLYSAGEDGTVRRWAAEGRDVTVLRTGPQPAYALALSPDGASLALLALETATDGEGHRRYTQLLQILELSSGRRIERRDELSLLEPPKELGAVAFSPDSTRLAACGLTGVKVLEQGSWATVAVLQERKRGHSLGSTLPDLCAFYLDGRLGTSANQHELKMWSMTAMQARATYTCDAPVRKMAFGDYLTAAVEGGAIWLWDFRIGQRVAVLSGHRGNLRDFACAPDHPRLYSAGSDGVIKVWDTAIKQELVSLRGPSADLSTLAVSPDGRTLAAGYGDGRILRWRPARPD